jgi:hypothetical protein
VDEWYDTLGAYAMALPPAIATDLALHGPPPGHVGYPLAMAMLRTGAELNPYPSEAMPELPPDPAEAEGVF